ncbi:MAG: protein translocase subunit SecD [Rickettsiales bacterium]|nr:protein translocase subunit SecD [Rickettsiales bacterium]
MLNFPRWKIILVSLICILAVFFALPTLLRNSSYYESLGHILPDNTVKLGLDLQGGVHLVLRVDLETYMKGQVVNLKNDVRSLLRNREQGTIGYTGGLPINEGRVLVTLRDPSQLDEAARRINRGRNDLVIDRGDGTLEVYFSESAITEMRNYVLNQSIEIVRKRVDETGTKEPALQRQGNDRIVLQMPGVTDSSEIKRRIDKTAKLTFHLLDPDTPYYDPLSPIRPAGSVLMFEDQPVEEGGQSIGYNVQRQEILGGESLINAASTFQEGQPVISFRFDNSGAQKFARVTKQNVGRPFAIILDGKVISAPVIREPILTGSGIISGNFTSQSASDLAVLLRAGALPADLAIIEERTIGPSLGSDSIEAGKKAFMVGIIFVMVFMVISYGRFGIYSNMALIVNAAMLLSVLSLIGATLTLPGIAGIVLTMGMAVDANVLIFERIREEIKSDKSVFAAVDAGFKHAFNTILDSNITTLIAALLLYNFGTGAIKGFAVTLSIGIIASMFSAILFTRMMVVVWLRKNKPTYIPI